MDCFEVLLTCLAGNLPYKDDAADQFIEILRTAEYAGKELEDRLKSVVYANGWTERLAESILHGIEKLLKESGKMATAMAEATKEATDTALEFAKEHPYYTALIIAGTIIAVGVLVTLAPWVLEALGFAARGPRLGSFAARWMSQIAKSEGHVSTGSIYAYLQSLGMTWA